jgi:hypothetical protein
MKMSEEGEWFLYIASNEVDGRGLAAAYRSLYTLVDSLGPLWVNRFELKLVEPRNPIARDVLGILNRYPSPLPTRYGGKRLGNVAVDDSYIYPLTAAA